MAEQRHAPLCYQDGSPYYFHAGKVGAVAFDMRLCLACGQFYAEGNMAGVPIRQFCLNPAVSVVSRAENADPAQAARMAYNAARFDAQGHSDGNGRQ